VLDRVGEFSSSSLSQELEREKARGARWGSKGRFMRSDAPDHKFQSTGGPRGLGEGGRKNNGLGGTSSEA